jgi:membrane protein DedA with SNARE-associated domain
MIAHMQFQAQDVVAVLLLIGIFTLKMYGLDGTFDAIIGTICGYYFGRRFSNTTNTNAQT